MGPGKKRWEQGRMQFIETIEGVLYPLQRVEKIKTQRADRDHPDGSDVIIYAEGAWHHTKLSEDQLATLSAAIIVPAERHSIVEYDPASGISPAALDVTPIIAFALAADGTMTPITADGPFRSTLEPAILRPDGKIEWPADCSIFNSIEEFKAYRRSIAGRAASLSLVESANS
jgi:hypothetical protein